MGLEFPSMILEPEMDAAPLLDSAVRFCATRLGKSEKEIVRALEAGDPGAHSTLRYAIAKGLSAHLAGLGRSIQAVYLYGSSMNGDARAGSDIDLIVIVGRKLDQAQALLRRLDVALVTAYRDLLGDDAGPRSMLDVHLVDVDEEVERQGYGAVVHSAETSPVCLWRDTPQSIGGSLGREPPRVPPQRA